LREAAALWWAVTEKHGIGGRDHIWSHPDLMPTADDLDDPLGFADTVGKDASLDIRSLAPSAEPEDARQAEPENPRPAEPDDAARPDRDDPTDD
jgi:hypothetical protein